MSKKICILFTFKKKFLNKLNLDYITLNLNLFYNLKVIYYINKKTII